MKQPPRKIPAPKPPRPNLHDAPEPTELIRRLWLKCEAYLKPGELAAYWKSGTLPPNCDPRLEDRLAAIRTLTLQTIDALYDLTLYRPVDKKERLYRTCLFKCGPTVVDNYLQALGREPTDEEWYELTNPQEHLFVLPDGIGIRMDLAAAFFPDLQLAAEGNLHPEGFFPSEDLLSFVVLGPTPETTADLPPEGVETMTELLQEMRNLITEARNGPPVMADWLALQALGRY